MINQLQALILDESQNLLKIEHTSKTLSFMEILGVESKELQHSNFLKWLFSPSENHQINDFFLRGFINLLNLEPERQIELNLADLNDTQVVREKDNIDILIINERLGFVICVENKIWSGLADHQLSKYHQIIEYQFSESIQKIYVYLTPFIRPLPPEYQDIYVNITYTDISKLMQETIRFNDLPNEYINMINDYMTNLDKNILGRSKETELAQAIYNKHKRAIDFIWKHRPNFGSIFNEINTFFSKNKNYVNLTPKDKRIIRILPTQIGNKFNHPFHSWGGTDSIFAIEIFCEAEKVIITFCFGGIWGYEALPAQHQEYQDLKTKYFDGMKEFESLKKYIRLKSKSTSHYPYVAIKNLLQIDSEIIFKSDTLFDAFKIEFEKFEREVLDKWVLEVNEKIG